MTLETVAIAIEDEMAARGVPGVSAAVVEGGSISWTGAFGVRSLGGDPVTQETVFEAASIGKPVFAWFVLGLVDEGVLDLNRPLADYTPKRIVADDEAKRITARMCLTHTSGLGWEVTGPSFEGRPCLEGEPGGEFQYSGIGFDYLKLVVEDLVGRPVQDIMREFMTSLSLGMARSNYAWHPSFDGNFASPHDLEGNVGDKEMSSVVESVGSQLHATASDLATFLCQILRPNQSPAHTESLEPQVQVRQEYLHGPPGPGAFWGLGIGVWHVDGESMVWHWGENPGFQSFLVGWPAQRKGIVVMTNSDHGHHVSKAAVRAFDGKDCAAIRWIEN